MSIGAALEVALSPKDRRSRINNLHGLVQELIDLKNNRKQIEQIFSDAALRFREQNREEDEDIVVEILDYISGWCSPSQYIKGLDYD